MKYRFLLRCAAAVVLVILSSAPAFGQSREIEIHPTRGPAGTEVTVGGLGFLGDLLVRIQWDGSDIGTARTDARGNFSFVFVAEGKAGRHLITVCQADPASGDLCPSPLRASFSIDPPPPSTTSQPPPSTTTAPPTTSPPTTTTTAPTTTAAATTTVAPQTTLPPTTAAPSTSSPTPTPAPRGEPQSSETNWLPWLIPIAAIAVGGILIAGARRSSAGAKPTPPAGPVPIPYPNIAKPPVQPEPAEIDDHGRVKPKFDVGSADPPPRESQYGETDFDFISRAVEPPPPEVDE